MKLKKNDKIPFNHYVKEVAYYIIHNGRLVKNTIPFDKKETLIIAHRGLSSIEKENTVLAFKLAGEHSYFGIETDVHKTADGKYVIIHDDNTLRVSGVDNIIEKTDEKTLLQIALTDINGNPSDKYRIPTLMEYIETCKVYGKYCILELKNHFEQNEVYEIAGIISRAGYLDKTVFISFDLPNLINLRKKYPTQAAQFLTCRYYEELPDILKEYNLDLDIYYREMTKGRVDLLHKYKIKVNCWTVNTKKWAKKLAEWGVDYITTNIME